MWQFEPTTQFERDKKWYEKKRPAEFAAVMHNLKRYLNQLEAAPNSRSILAGYLHHEPYGVVAIDQKGGGGKTTTTIGLAQGLNAAGHRAAVAIRQPSGDSIEGAGWVTGGSGRS